MPLYARWAKKDRALLLCGGAQNTCSGVLATWEVMPEKDEELGACAERELVFYNTRLEGDLLVPRGGPRRQHLGQLSGPRAEHHADVRWPLKVACRRCGAINLIEPDRLNIEGRTQVATTFRQRYTTVDGKRVSD